MAAISCLPALQTLPVLSLSLTTVRLEQNEHLPFTDQVKGLAKLTQVLEPGQNRDVWGSAVPLPTVPHCFLKCPVSAVIYISPLMGWGWSWGGKLCVRDISEIKSSR